MSVLFYLGTHQPQWLSRTDIPLFVSRRTLFRRRTFPRSAGRWALDSGGFSELSLFGRWTIDARQYVAEVRRYRDEIGGLDWAACQDWMCEPFVLAKTGLAIVEHQRRTLANYLDLRSLAPDLPWVPVIQGYAPADYLRHVDDYAWAGVDLAVLDRVGVGSICRRQATAEAAAILASIAALGIRSHGFGLKVGGLKLAHASLASADSMAWSKAARMRAVPLPGCVGHKNCANCQRYARLWYLRIVGMLGEIDDDPEMHHLRPGPAAPILQGPGPREPRESVSEMPAGGGGGGRALSRLLAAGPDHEAGPLPSLHARTVAS